jgi:predicted cupin superfamily sugar epimerase
MDVNARAIQLIEELSLAPHPEGGYFREIHRAAARVQPADQRGARAALTVIYFLLPAGDVSRWHRVASDEAWHFHEGDPLELFTTPADLGSVRLERLGPLAADTAPVRVVPAGYWQAARSTGAYTLASCTVGPGFDFADFEMLRDAPGSAPRFNRLHPALASLL